MSAINGPLFTDPTHLAKLKTEARAGSTDNLREVARQFESLFTHMLMKNMRAASLGGGIMDSDQSKFYQDMFDQQMSTELTRGQGLGIADLLVRQLGGEQETPPAGPLVLPALRRSASADASPNTSDRRVNDTSASTSPGNVGINSAATDDSPERGIVDFVRKALPHARRIGQALGVAPKFILAQAALESGWGRKPIANPDGSDSHNVFGIKAGSSWAGSRAVVSTLEFASGIGERVNAAFRSYRSMAESFDDYARLLLDNSRYKDALQTGDDGNAFAGALKRGGYATDPDYAAKIMDIADGKTLANAMSVATRDDSR